MGRRAAVALAAGAAAALLGPGAAQGRTLGTVAWPAGEPDEVACDVAAPPSVGYQESETGTSWTVPGRGLVTSWSTDVETADPGAGVSLVVLRPGVSGQTIVAVDTRTFPAPLPAGGVATFRPASAIAVEPGDRLGIAGTAGAICGWRGGAIPAGLAAVVGRAAPSVTPGALVTPWVGPLASPSHLNLAAEILEAVDVRVTAAAGPANAVAGGLAQLSATVANAGPAASSVTVTDTVPAGLSIVTAVAGGGSCAVAGQQVTCEIPSLEAGASVPVVVLVTPAAPGAYANTVAAEPPLELAPADNAASATLTVAAPPSAPEPPVDPPPPGPPAPPTPRCVVPALTRTPLAVARGLLRQLDCKPGAVTRQRSAKIPRGAVIATRPGRGRYRAGSTVRLLVSSGKPPRRTVRRAQPRRSR